MNKKGLFSLMFLFCVFYLNAQTISTIAGNGANTYSGDGGPGTSASIGFPGFINFDQSGNFYFEELNNTIRQVSSGGTIRTIAGNGSAGFSGDNGPATLAQLNFPGGGGAVCDLFGNLYVADQSNNRIRKIDGSSGIISTIAGTGTSGYGGDGGPASASLINSPVSITIDINGNLYFLDGFNNRIRKINVTGIITTFAGNGINGFYGDGGPATAARISSGGGIHVAPDNFLYHADGFRIRKINLSSGIITTIAGSSVQGFSGDGGPATAAQLFLAIDVAVNPDGYIYISDVDNNRIRMINPSGIITTILGNGAGAYSGDGGPASVAQINSARGIVLDSCGSLYIVDNGNHRIRKLSYPHCNFLGVENKMQPVENIIVSPNPTPDNLNIRIMTPCTYRLLNLLGATTQQGTLKAGDNTISIKALPTGMYMLELTDEERNRTVTKIIKQ
jgi:sugar lactone lactonase YvrE